MSHTFGVVIFCGTEGMNATPLPQQRMSILKPLGPLQSYNMRHIEETRCSNSHGAVHVEVILSDPGWSWSVLMHSSNDNQSIVPRVLDAVLHLLLPNYAWKQSWGSVGKPMIGPWFKFKKYEKLNCWTDGNPFIWKIPKSMLPKVAVDIGSAALQYKWTMNDVTLADFTAGGAADPE